MAEFLYRGEKIIGIDEPVTLENNTGTSFDVSVGVGIIFRKSGLYRVSVDGKHTSVKIEPKRKKGKWIERDDCWDGIYYECSVCKDSFTLIDGNPSDNNYNFCPSCGSYNGGEEDE